MKVLSEVRCLNYNKLVWRNVVNIIGSLLIFIGLILLIPVAFVILVIIAIPGDLGDVWPTFLWMVPVFGLSATGVIIAGLRIKRKYRRIVLYLRRFGFVDSARALTFAVSNAIGKRWKLLTLDDTKTAPVGLARSTKGLYGIGKWILLLIVIAGLAYGAHLFYGGGLDKLLNGVAENVPNQPNNPDQGIIGNFLVQLFTSVFYILIVGMIVLTFAVIGYVATALIIPLAIFTWGASRSVKKAEKRKAYTIDNESDLDIARQKLIIKLHGIFSPRLVIVKVANDIWQKVVRVFSDNADIVLIDVSIPTDNLLWEICMLREESNLKWVFVGDKEYISNMEQEILAHRSNLEIQLRKILENEEVLVYDETNRHMMKSFSKSMRNHLENKFCD